MIAGEEGLNFGPNPAFLRGTYTQGTGFFLLVTHNRDKVDYINFNVTLHQFLSETSPTASYQILSKKSKRI
jgi:hypothetical protein